MNATLDKVVRSPRLAARRRAVRSQQRRRRRRIGIGLLLLAGAVAGGVIVSRSLLFDLARVDVVGARSIDPAAVVEASGLRIGESVLGVDLDAVAARVQRLPGVREARVERDGSLALRIVVVERSPAVEIQSGSRRWLLDEDGQPVPEGVRADGAIPLIAIPRAPGVGAVLPRGTSAAVLEIWNAMPEPMRRQLGSFEPIEGEGFVFMLGRTRVLFGPAERIVEKVDAISLVRERVSGDRKRLIRLDVRSPERPAAKIA